MQKIKNSVNMPFKLSNDVDLKSLVIKQYKELKHRNKILKNRQIYFERELFHAQEKIKRLTELFKQSHIDSSDDSHCDKTKENAPASNLIDEGDAKRIDSQSEGILQTNKDAIVVYKNQDQQDHETVLETSILTQHSELDDKMNSSAVANESELKKDMSQNEESASCASHQDKQETAVVKSESKSQKKKTPNQLLLASFPGVDTLKTIKSMIKSSLLNPIWIDLQLLYTAGCYVENFHKKIASKHQDPNWLVNMNESLSRERIESLKEAIPEFTEPDPHEWLKVNPMVLFDKRDEYRNSVRNKPAHRQMIQEYAEFDLDETVYLDIADIILLWESLPCKSNYEYPKISELLFRVYDDIQLVRNVDECSFQEIYDGMNSLKSFFLAMDEIKWEE